MGYREGGTITTSYYNSQTTGQSDTGKGVAKTTAYLLAPTSSTGIYGAWNGANWDFGTNEEYPVLKIDVDGNGTAGEEADLLAQRPPLGDAFIEVSTLEQLDAIRYDLDGNGEVEDDTNQAAYSAAFGDPLPVGTIRGYQLINDLDFELASSYASGTINTTWTRHSGWEPIGDNSSKFTAIFEGNGHTISNLHINKGQFSSNVGLFSYVSGSNAVLRNIGLLEVKVTGNTNVGGLVGVNEEGTVANSYATGAVTGSFEVGGLVGYNTGTISGSYATGAVTGGSSVGGLVGKNSGGTISGSYATGAVTGTSSGSTGGLVGKNSGGTISGSYATGSVTNFLSGSDSTGLFVGGLVGKNSGGTVSNSYATGAVTGYREVGGLVGSNTGGTILSSYATGAVSGSLDVGGLVGFNTGTVTASYYNSEATEQSDTGKGVAKTTAELVAPTGSTDIYATWNSATDWDFGTNLQYPVLKIDVDGDGTAGDATDLRAQRPLRFRQTSYDFAILNTASINDVVGIVRAVPEDENNELTYSMGTSTEFSISSEDETDNPSKVGQISVKAVLSTNTYTLNVEVMEASGGTATVEVRIKVDPSLDADGNDLIEVSTLEQLNAIRYDLNGDGEVDDATNEAAYSAAFGTMTCTDCTGYELINDLDFEVAGSYASSTINATWTTGSGWEPIGDNSSRFTAIFEGNRHTISNLFIDRSLTNYVGLFGYVSGNTTELRNIGLLEIEVTGNLNVGGLVGSSEGDISNSYATGAVTGHENVGGLVGNKNAGTVSNSYATGSVMGDDYLGGLVAYNDQATVSNSYATGSVTGTTGEDVGGLVGYTYRGTVSNSYATGSVTGVSDVGGLVGRSFGGTVSNSYATGSVTGSGSVGGLVGSQFGGTITASYYNSQTTGQSDTGKGVAKTTAYLLAPTSSTGIYATWGVDHWDFGANEEYPVLKIDVNGNGTAGDLADLRAQRPLRLEADGDGLIEVSTLEQLNAIRYDLTGNGEDITNEVAYNAAFGVGVLPGIIRGYELINDLDFNDSNNDGTANDPSKWAEGASGGDVVAGGWESIGDNSSRFTAIFEGNGHTISNLFIDKSSTNYIGLFGYISGNSAELRNIGLLEVKVTGDEYVGGLVGANFQSTVSGSYATGAVEGNNNVGGLVGNNFGEISVSYTTGTVTGNNNVGGLVGWNNSGSTVSDSYATSTVTGNGYSGGLVGRNQGTVLDSYATGAVTGNNNVGGLVGNNTGTVTASYYNSETTEQIDTGKGEPKTTSGLVAPTNYTGIYGSWDDLTNYWEFGTNEEYPVLKIDVNGNGTAGDTDDLALQRPAGLSVNPTSLDFLAGGEGKDFMITSNADWTATSDRGWLTLSRASGTNNATVTATAGQNTATSLRTATITLTATGVTDRTIAVTQAAAAATLSVNPTSLDFIATGEGKSFSITSNGDWTAASNRGWLTLSRASGTNNVIVRATAGPNTTTSSRTATITLTANGAADRTITVRQAAPATLSVSPGILAFVATGAWKNFMITSNTTWRVASNRGWLTLTRTSGTNNMTVRATAGPNTTTSLRTATITLTANGVPDQTIAVTQAAAAATLSVSPGTLAFAATGAEKSFSITSNTIWTAAVSTGGSWLTLNRTSGTNNATVRATAGPNTTTSLREATILLTANGVADQTIAVIQAAAAATLSVSPGILNFVATGEGKNFMITSNADWTAASDRGWLTLSRTSGTNNATVRATAGPNTATSLRTATITLTANGVPDRTIAVIQAAAAATLSVTRNTLYFVAGGQGINFMITSNVDWTVTSNRGWLTLNMSSGGSGTTTLRATAEANVASMARTGTLRFTGGGLTKAIAVAQAAAGTTLSVDENTLSFTVSGGDLDFNIMSNVDWVANSDQDWLTLSSDSGNGNSIITATAQENLGAVERTATLSITGESILQTIDVTQTAAVATLSVNPTSLDFLAGGEEKDFMITSNADWTVASDRGWLTLDMYSGTNNATVRATAVENVALVDRTGTVTITVGTLTQTVTVRQVAAVATLSVSLTRLDFLAGGEEKDFMITSNADWAVAIDRDWLTLSRASGTNNATIRATAMENVASIARTGTLTITGSGLTRTIAVEQVAAVATLNVSTGTLDFFATGEDREFMITSNADWTAEVSGGNSWLTLDMTSGTNNATVTATTTPNVVGSPRMATITLTVGTLVRIITVTQATLTVPVAPTSLTATAVSATQIDLTWDIPSDGGDAITGYLFEYSEDGSIPWVALTTSSTMASFSDNTELTRGTTRHYRIAAINSVGTGASSQQVSATTHDVPDAPTDLTATPGEAQVTLSWVVPANRGKAITHYAIKVADTRVALESFVAVQVAVADLTGGDGTSQGANVNYVVTMTGVDSGTPLANGTAYFFQVAAVNSVDTGNYSTTTEATTWTVPVAPNLTATAVSATQIDLTWDIPSDGGSAITSYLLEYSENGNIPWVALATSSTMILFSDNTELTRGTTRHYRVAAINSVGTGAYSEQTSTTTHDLPDAPKNLTATPGETQVTLSWEVPASGGNAITHYAIKIADTMVALGSSGAVQVAVAEVSGDGTSEGVNVNYVVTMTGVDSGTPLVNNTEYFFQVAAVNSVDTGEYSASGSATPGMSAPPAVPASLAVTSGDAKMTLSWVVPANGGEAITHYAIKIADTREALESFVGVQVAVGDLTGDGTSVGASVNYIVTMTGVNSGATLVNGTTYFFQIAAVNSIGTGNYSSTIDATTTVPDAPTNLTATAMSATQIDLSWDAPSQDGGDAITGYVLQYSVDGNVPWTDLTTSVTTTTFSDNTGLDRGTTRHYRVAAINIVGTGASSQQVSATTHDVPDAPTDLTATPGEAQVTLSWVVPANRGNAITHYAIKVADTRVALESLLAVGDLTGGDGTSEGENVNYVMTMTGVDSGTALVSGTAYFFQVAAVNSVDTGEYSTTTEATTLTVPVAPTNLTAIVVSEMEISLSWEVPSDGGSPITDYLLEYSADGNIPWVALATSGTMIPFSDNTGLTRGTTRHYRVAAINSVGTGAYSEQTSATTHDVPDAPTNLTATPGETQVTLSWVVPASGGDAITHYAIKIADTSDALDSFVAVHVDVTEVTGDGTSEGVNVNYVVTMIGVDSGTPLANDTEYFFQVAAVNSVDTGEYSASGSATPGMSAPPAVPASLTATPGDAKMTLSWVVPANGGDAITHYAIKIADTREALESFVAVQVAVGEVTGDGTSVGASVNYIVTMTGVDSGTDLVNGTTYFFQIAAVNSIGTGNYTNTIDATTTVPGAPTNLTATVVSDTQINLSWDAPLQDGGLAITGYLLEYSTDGNGSWTDLTTSGTTTSFDNTGLTVGSTRHYRVAAINNVGTGEYSTTTDATTAVATPGAPTNLTATAVSETQISLSWETPSQDGGEAITDYELEYSTDGNIPWTDLTTSGTMITFSDNTELTRGTTRHYRVAAINSVGTGAYSEQTSATTYNVPDAPTNLTATPGDAQVTLSWVVPASGGDAITHYAIKIADTSDALGAFVAVHVDVTEVTGGGTSEGVNVNYVVTMTEVGSGTPLANDTEYFFQVAAVNSVDTGEYSASDSATPGMPAPPAVPTNWTATPGDAQMTLNWVVSANGGDAITHYAIKIADTRDALGSFVAVQVAVGDLTGDGTSVGANVSYIVTMTEVNSGSALVNGTTYFFQIAAVNSIGTGNYSTTIDATTTVPDAPTNLTATVVSEMEINLSWEMPSENGGVAITGYDLEFSADENGPWTDLTTSVTTTSFSDNTGLTVGSTRHYRVAAINIVGTGEYSTTTDATLTVPGVPTNLTATAVSETQINLSWDAPSRGWWLSDYGL